MTDIPQVDATPLLILVSGLPATGKSTLAEQIAEALQLPLVVKDAMKELLFEYVGWNDRPWSQRLGAASTKILWYMVDAEIKVGHSIVAESNYVAHFTDGELAELRAKYPVRVVAVHCVVPDRAVLVERYIARANEGNRHPGHGEQDDTQLHSDLVPRLEQAVDVPPSNVDRIITIDTTDPDTIDLAELIHDILA